MVLASFRSLTQPTTLSLEKEKNDRLVHTGEKKGSVTPAPVRLMLHASNSFMVGWSRFAAVPNS